jgi:hypothetical protein
MNDDGVPSQKSLRNVPPHPLPLPLGERGRVRGKPYKWLKKF